MKHDKKIAMGEGLDNDMEECPLPPLPTKRDAKKGAEIAEKDARKQGPQEPKGKEKVTVVTTRQDMRKLQPRKSTRAFTTKTCRSRRSSQS